MRTIALLASVVALSLIAPACTVEEAAPVTSSKPKKGKSTKPGATNENGEHGSNAPADSDQGEPEAGDAITADETWDTGKTIASNKTINSGVTVTIKPGAAVSMGANVAITVKGTLKVAATANHAKMTGASWMGLVIASGGKLDADGLEMKGASSGIWTQPDNAPSTFKNGVLDASTPFKMDAGSNLTIDHSKVIAGGGSVIAGTFAANYMDYDKGTNGGLTLNDKDGTMTINNSLLHGGGGGDYVISNAGKKVSVTRSKISGSHCGLHFSGEGPASFLIDGVELVENGVAGMLYNSGAGPNLIKNTKVTITKPTDVEFELGSNGNGQIEFTNVDSKLPTAANVKDNGGAGPAPGDIGPLPE